MSIKTRLALLVGFLLLAFAIVLHLLRQMEREQAEQLVGDSLLANQKNLRQWIDLTNQPLQRFSQDYGAWEELAAYVHQPDDRWAETHLRGNLLNYQAHALWVFAADGRLLYATRRGEGPPLPSPLAAGDLATLARGVDQHFFTESRDGLLEIWAQPIAARMSAPPGWLLVARLWDDAHLDMLARLSETQLQLTPVTTALGPPAPGQRSLPLPGRHATVVRRLQAQQALPPVGAWFSGEMAASRLFIVFGLLLIAAVWLGVRQWIARPLQVIGESLRHDNPVLVQPLLSSKNEFGQVAALIANAVNQKTTLVREIAERTRVEEALRLSQTQLRHAGELRARLARDLHDGVIQSIYAAGLGLESALAQLGPDPAGARRRLLVCRQSLNDTIREVRNFINGLEPDPAQPQSFPQALEALIHTMQAFWSVTIVPALDEITVRQLTPAQEVHLLQITREGLSNALRHGEARQVRLTLHAHAGHATYELRDDGRGFDPQAPGRGGLGLRNLATRARDLNGTLALASRPGAGTTLIVTFPLTTAVL